MQMPNRNRAFTCFELIFVIAALLLLAMLMPWRHSSSKLSCINYLKQIGVGFRVNANDNDGKLPMQLSTNAGGTLEYTNAGQAYRHFLAAADEITRAYVLVCPDDRKRAAVVDFSSNSIKFNNANISYFINVNADESTPDSILAGDRHLKVPPGNGDRFAIRRGTQVAWTKEMHSKGGRKGYMVMSDGSAEQFSSSQLQAWLTRNTNDHLFHFPNIR